jgi:hypothetical protein
MMDSALVLRQNYDRGIISSPTESAEQLERSGLIHRLTMDFEPRPLFVVWRLLALAEIPGASTLPYTRQVAEWALVNIATAQGFSVMGSADQLLPCYNAMLVNALARLGYGNRPEVLAGVEWITTYQPFDRLTRSTWTGKGTLKYGGCLKAVPCYIGQAKAVKALQAYQRTLPEPNPVVDDCIRRGVETILNQRVCYRLHDDQPITPHILDLSFPESYHLNLIELLQILKEAGRLNDPRCKAALAHVLTRKRSDGWRVNYRYKSAGYVCFDIPGGRAEWVTYLINEYIQSVE